MTHTPEPWSSTEYVVWVPVARGYQDDYEWEQQKVADTGSEDDAARIVAAVNACAGVPLGEGASVKRLVEALALFLAVHAEGGFIEPDDDVLAGGRVALAPFIQKGENDGD